MAPRPSHPARGQGAEDTEEPEETAATTRRTAPPCRLEQGADLHERSRVCEETHVQQAGVGAGAAGLGTDAGL